MIISRISGGLGNQMFQYAAGRAVAIREKTELKLDISGYPDDKFGRHYRLDFLNINATLASPEEVKKLKPVESLLTKKSPKLYSLLSNFKKTYISESLNGEAIPYGMSNLYLDGYWQNEKYFKDYSDEIQDDFRLLPSLYKKTADYLKVIKSSNSIALSIRRGDYVNVSRIKNAVGICGAGYFERAAKFISDRVDNPVFFIFSEPDGLEWAKSKLKLNCPSIPILDVRDYEQMYLISQCKHGIIPNSTFGWWGAWLNRNPQKIVIAPDPWFSSEPQKKIIPYSWIKLPKINPR